MKIDVTMLKHVRPEIDKALADLGKRFGIVFHAAHGTYTQDGQTASFKLELTVPTADGVTKASTIRARADWDRYAQAYGLQFAWLGREVPTKNGPAKIIGLLIGRPKFPVLVSFADGKELLMTVDGVKRILTLADYNHTLTTGPRA